MAKETNSQEPKKTGEKQRDLVAGLSLNRSPERYRMPPCIEFPKFSGKNLMGWLYKCEQFFDLDSTPPSARLKLVALHLEGKYLNWHIRYMRMRSSEPTWDEYVAAFNARFVELFSESPIAELTHLSQDGELEGYIDEFDAVMSRLRVDFCEDFAVSRFVSGLKPDIQYWLQMFPPKTLQNAYRTAKLREDANLAESARIASEMYAMESPEYGQINLITVCGVEGVITRKEDDPLSLKKGIDESNLQLSDSALYGAGVKYEMMTISESFGTKNVLILIDSGSTHNLLDADVAEMMGCQLTKIELATATLANGEMMECKYVCRGFTWQMQGVQFTADVWILPFRKSKMVLGIQWLSTLGDVLWNFQTLRMEFVKDQKKVVLQGTNNSRVQQTSEDENRDEVPLQRNIHVCSVQDEILPTIQLSIQTANSSIQVKDSTETSKKLKTLMNDLY